MIDCTTELKKQRICALERQIQTIRELGDIHSTPDDRYGGLMWYDDVELLEDWVKELKS